MDANEFAQSLQEFASRYLAEYTRNVERYAAFVSGIDKQTLGPGEALQQRYAEFVVAESSRYLGQLAEASLQYYQLLASMGVESANRFFEQVLQVEGTQPQPPKRQAPAALMFRGMRGHSASNAFLVTNNRNQAIDVSFDVTEVVSADGETRFRPSVQFTPETCRLAARSQQVVECSLLLSDQFQARQTHSGHIQVVGFPEMAIRISVQVDEPAAPVSKDPTSM